MAKFYGVGVGVGVVCLDEAGRILVGRRKGSHGAGTFALPGGHLELGETWEDCARRELLEETGLVLKPGALEHIYTSNDRMESDKHYITIFVVGKIAQASTPQNLEPEKCHGWEFRTWEELRATSDPMFVPLRALVSSAECEPWEPKRALVKRGANSAAVDAASLLAAAFLGAGAALLFLRCKSNR